MEEIRTFKEVNGLYKELNELYHEMALKIGLSDSALTVFWAVMELGDGCLQKDICAYFYISKQTIHSSVRKLEKDGYLYLQQGKGKDKQIHLTKQGEKFAKEKVCPIMKIEMEAFQDLSLAEQREFIRLERKYVEGFRRRGERLFEEGRKGNEDHREVFKTL